MKACPICGAGLFFISPATTKCRIVFSFFEFIEQDVGLQIIAAGIEAFLFFDLSFIDGFLHRTHMHAEIVMIDEPIAIHKRFREVVSGIYMQ